MSEVEMRDDDRADEGGDVEEEVVVPVNKNKRFRKEKRKSFKPSSVELTSTPSLSFRSQALRSLLLHFTSTFHAAWDTDDIDQ